MHFVRVYVLCSMYACHKQNMAEKKREREREIEKN